MPDRKKIVEIRHFKMKFGNKTVIKNLSFDVFQGEVFGFLAKDRMSRYAKIALGVIDYE